MLKLVASFYNANQTRILLCAVCFALITNIATIMVLFEQLEHESLCDQQNEFNDFVEDYRHDAIHQNLQSIKEEIKQPKSDKFIIPKPNKLEKPPRISPKISSQKVSINEEETTTTSKVRIKKNVTASILDVQGIDYEIHEFEASEIQATDWKYYLDINLPALSYRSTDCNYNKFVSSIFMDALSKWIWMREYGWFPQYHCPLFLQTEYRPIDLIPHIYQTQCTPFWPSDIIYLLSQILSPSMLSIQYGFSLSSLWLTNFIEKIYIVDNRKEKILEYKEYLKKNKYDLSNIEIEWIRMSKKYVHRIDPNKGKIVDFIVIEYVPEYHDDVLKYAVNILKENNGILLIKLYDENIPNNIEELINDLIPKEWLRYNSYIPPFLTKYVPFSQEVYLEQYNVSIWITRTQQNPCKLY